MRSQTRRFFSTLSLGVLALVALACCTVPTVNAEENKSEYGTVIGIGMSTLTLFISKPPEVAPQIWELRMFLLSSLPCV